MAIKVTCKHKNVTFNDDIGNFICDDCNSIIPSFPEQDELRYLRAEYEANKDKVWTDADMSKKDAEIERLRELIEKAFNEYNSLWKMSVEHLAFVWQQFKTENNL